MFWFRSVPRSDYPLAHRYAMLSGGVHACRLISSYLRVLVETPRANLLAGVKWLPDATGWRLGVRLLSWVR